MGKVMHCGCRIFWIQFSQITIYIFTFYVSALLFKFSSSAHVCFHKDRFIQDNVILEHEIIHHCKVTRQQGLLSKWILRRHVIRSIGAVWQCK